MKIDAELIEKLAHLSKIELKEEEKEEMITELEKMIQFIEKLDELNTEGIPPLTHMSTESINREDEVKGEIAQKDVFQNVENKSSDYFQVPKVIKKEF